jgi:hypothetical protein
VRRQFYEIQVKTPAPIATEALVRIAALYAIEADIRGLAADERRQARQRRTKPLVDDLRLWLEAQFAAVSGKSTIAGAIRYASPRESRTSAASPSLHHPQHSREPPHIHAAFDPHHDPSHLDRDRRQRRSLRHLRLLRYHHDRYEHGRLVRRQRQAEG